MSDSDYTDVIEEPKNNPAAHRVWELLSLFQQAHDKWQGLVYGIAHGYSQAWYRQQDVLQNTKSKIQAERDFQCFIVSIFAAGICGGLMGGLIGGAFEKASQITDTIAAMGDDAASQVGGSFFFVFQEKLSNSTFSSPGVEPSTYESGMHKNVSVFFMGLQETIKQVIDDLLAGKMPASEAESWYQYFRNVQFIKNVPSSKYADSDFTRPASLCLWIAWGAQRDLKYWNKAWRIANDGPNRPHPVAVYDFHEQRRYDEAHGYYIDIDRWDLIVDEIAHIDPKLVYWVRSAAPGLYDATGRNPQYAGLHLDVRKLSLLGLFSNYSSALAMSRYLKASSTSETPMGASAARKLLASAFSKGSEFLRADP
jgi:hypothetical protein